MVVAELLPLLQELSYTDKLQILHFLTSELLNDAGLSTGEKPNGASIPSLHNSFEAAAVLAQALAEHQATTHG
jgi:hypothetical protein